MKRRANRNNYNKCQNKLKRKNPRNRLKSKKMIWIVVYVSIK